MRSTIPMFALLLAGCWKTDAAVFSQDTVPLNPQVGAPEGWTVDRFDMDLTCPDGEPARFYLVYPEDAARISDDANPPALPVAILFHSGSFDYVFAPSPAEPLTGTSFRQSLGAEKRVTSEWAFTRVFTTLGLYPNYDPVEVHAGSLPAALAEKGIATMLPANCWGDLWHNRSSLADNNYAGDFFFRNGRTAAEFSYLYLTEDFPAGNPLELPIEVDAERIYMVGLGEGARAVTEMLNISETVGGETVYPYSDVAGVVLDSHADDLRPYFQVQSDLFQQVRSGLSRLFIDGEAGLMEGTLTNLPNRAFPNRLGFLYSTQDTELPAGSVDSALDRIDTMAASRTNLWVHASTEQRHVLSNSDAVLAKAVADFLVEGVGGIEDAALIDGP